MHYLDPLYGEVQISPLMYELSQSSCMRRLRRISQGVLPADCMVRSLPSRFEHCMGVAHLALYALLHSRRTLGRYELLFVLASMLHDAGNTGLSHLSEHFLRQLFKLDGESFLRVLLDKTDTARLLEQSGYSIEETTQFVTGRLAPYSIALHGSMDVDNLDNVLRYLYTVTRKRGYDAEYIAGLFRFNPERAEWYLHDDGNTMSYVRQWQAARREVYAHIYAESHLSAASMVYHALDLAVERGEVGLDYFKLTDDDCLAYLYDCNEDSKYLVERVLMRDRFEQIFERSSRNGHGKLAALCHAKDRFGTPDARKQVEDMIVAEVGVPRRAFCCYAAAGRDERRVTLPMVAPDGSRRFDHSTVTTPYRLFVYLDPGSQRYKEPIIRLMERTFPRETQPVLQSS